MKHKSSGIKHYVCSIDNCLKSYASKMSSVRHKITQLSFKLV